MKRRITGLLMAVALTSAAALAATSAASAAGVTQVDGIQTLVSLGDPFDPVDDVYWMDGYGDGRPALIGYWYTRSSVLGVATPSGVFTSTGTEEFVGCLDANGNGACDPAEAEGTIGFAFNASVKFDLVTFAQYHGRCYHPITGGTGGFADVAGVLRFKDDPEEGCSFYSGHLTLAG